ncbi:Uncharacterised protein [Cedecea neteri]|uniref:Uncharacterized protein n=1 Tax=Cedecea neteri TaxID=158822 RepID=A0A2X2T268_9ENTR|nr:Uncharacterised protein [Cedecea neteri]
MSTIGNMLNLATALPQLALNATPEGMAANLLKNVGDQMGERHCIQADQPAVLWRHER